jgi:P4 family phage/plasmid primase-like protien
MELLQVVKQYVDAGIQVVCVHSHLCANKVKRGKAPSHYGWQKERLSYEALEKEIQRVQQKEGACNIGVVTGSASGLVCIDVDDASWYNEHEMHLGNPVVERSSAGKMHLWYKHPGVFLKSRSSGARIFRGVDILSDGGNQVVTWPSIHSSGEPYRFDNGLTLLDALAEADVLPKWIQDEMMQGQQEEERRPGSTPQDGSTLDYLRAERIVRELPGAVQGQGGDLNTLKAALICRDLGLNEHQVYELLAKEYNSRCSPPWEPRELQDKVINAFKYARGTKGSMSIGDAFQEAVDTIEIKEPEKKVAYSKKHPGFNANVVRERVKGLLDVFDTQFIFYDTNEKRWKVVSDATIDALILKDMKTLMGQEFVNDLKVQMISDTRKLLKMDLDKAQDIPDVHFKGRNSREYITVGNGILDVERGELEPHTPDWFSFHSLPMVYEESAECKGFLKFLEDIWDGDMELIESLRLWMGYCLLTSCSFEKFAVFKGASRAGKSTLASVIEGIVGRENTASTSLSLIGSDFGLQNLMGKKLCVFQDAERASLDRMGVATERIKSLSSNEPIGINRKGQSVVFQRMGLKIAFVCNRLPNFLNDESALTNRMIVFPFWKSFAGREDTNLKERLFAELPGIFNWALVGARRLLRGEKLFTSQRGQEEMESIVQQLDSVQGFVAECMELTEMEHNILRNEELWKAYKTWCEDSNRGAKNRQRFFMEIHSHPRLVGRRTRTSAFRGFHSVKLKLDGYFPDDQDDGSDVPF